MGVVEEVGELAHAHLKFNQSIRGYSRSKYLFEAGDAIGDIIIYLASYCNTNEIELDFAVHDAWERVKKRDWIVDPVGGGE